MTQDQSPLGQHHDEPAIQLLEGDATPAGDATSPLMRILRGTVFGTVLLSGTALLAVSTVPGLSRYAAFLPGGEAGASACSASNSRCTTIDQVVFSDSPCGSVAASCAAKASGCCAGVESAVDTCLTAAEGPSSCCATLSRAALLTSAAKDAPCCDAATAASATEPLDAGSLLATETTGRTEDAAENGTEPEDQSETAQD